MFLKKIFLKGLVLALLSFAVTSGVNFVLAQNWTEPAAAPPGGNVPGVIWNSAVSGSQQTASFYVSGTGRVGGGGAFGGFAPDAVWMVSSPNAYFGNGVAGTIIGAGAGQAAGDISTDGVLKANRVRARGGTYASPGISFSAETDDGMMITDESGGYHALALVVGGAPIAVMDTGYFTVYGYGVIGSGFGTPLTLRSYTTTNDASSVGIKMQNAGGELSAVGAKSISFANGVTEEAYLGAGAGNPRLVLLGRAGQTGNLLEARNSAGSIMTMIGSGGNVGIGTISPSVALTVNRNPGAVGPLVQFHNAGNVANYGGLWISTTDENTPYVFRVTTNGIAGGAGTRDRMVVAGNGNIGIGTTGPSAKLEISQATSDAGGNALEIDGTGVGAQSWQWYPSSNQSLNLMRPGLRLAMFGNDGSFAVGGLNNDAGASADFFVNGTTGNVGVGNTAPATKLDVTGNINSSADITGARLCIGADCRNSWPVAGGGGDITGVAVGTGVTGGGVSGDVTVSLDTAYTDGRYVNVPGDTMTGSLVISGAGNDLTVADSGAFGTFSPDATWKVSSPNAYFGNGVQGTIIGAGGTQLAGQIKTDGKLTAGKVNTGPGAFFNNGEGFASALNLSGTADMQGNNLYLNIAGSNSYYLNSQTLSIGWAGAGLITTAGGSMTIAPAGASALLLQPNGGNVGIGASSPNATLEVKNSGSPTEGTIRVGIAGTAAFSSGIDFYTDNSSVRRGFAGWRCGSSGAPLTACGMYLVNYDNSNLILGTNGAEQLRMDWQGNVGIGKTATTKLDVAGNILSSGDVTGTRLCIGADCRNAWPVAGGGGDMTGVSAGTGLTGGGLSGDVTLSLDTTYADGRYVNVPGDTMTGSLVISGAGNDLTVADAAAFGGHSPNLTWDVSAPNAYFGDGIAGTIIGAGGGQAAGAITTDGNVTIGNDLRIVTNDSGNPGMPWIRSSGTYLVINSNTGALYLNQDVAQPIYLAQQQDVIAANGYMGLGTINPNRRLTLGGTTPQIDLGVGAGYNDAGSPGIFWYSDNINYGIYKTAGGWVAPNYQQLQLAWNTGIVIDGGSAYGRSGTVLQPSGGNVGIGKYPTTRLDVAGNILSSGDVTGTRLCIGADCRNAWPAGGGGGDVTGVYNGTGLTGGGASGELTLSLDTAYTDGQYINATGGDSMTGNLTFVGNSAIVIGVGGVIATPEICLNGDCRLAWPAGGGGDVTGVYGGSGLTGGAASGEITLNVGAGTGISVAADTVSWTGNTLAANSGLKGNGTPGNPLHVGAGNGITVTSDTVNFGGLTKALTSGLKGSGSQADPLYIGSGNGIIVGSDYIAVNDNTFVNEGGDSMSGNYTITGSLCVRNASACPGSAAGAIYWDTAVANPFDVAEYILSKQGLEPGEVVVIDPDVDEQVLRSYKAKDTAVAGVVSTKPGYLGGGGIEVLAGTQKVMLTLAGRIPVKVIDEGGPIKRGDLLTTSNTPGYAMKCADPSACVGAVVGKAMGELKEGKGTIVVLMSLQ